MESSKKIPLCLIHGRFQPPHNGHLRYILSALSYSEHLLIGICTPKICSDEEAARTGYPCAPALNPFSYSERVAMITAALNNEKISESQYSFIPFPSDYKNLKNIIPDKTTFLMSVTSESDLKKNEYIKNLGFKVETIIDIPEGSRSETSGSVRESASQNDSTWESMVPKAVSEYIKSNNLVTKLSGLSKK